MATLPPINVITLTPVAPAAAAPAVARELPLKVSYVTMADGPWMKFDLSDFIVDIENPTVRMRLVPQARTVKELWHPLDMARIFRGHTRGCDAFTKQYRDRGNKFIGVCRDPSHPPATRGTRVHNHWCMSRRAVEMAIAGDTGGRGEDQAEVLANQIRGEAFGRWYATTARPWLDTQIETMKSAMKAGAADAAAHRAAMAKQKKQAAAAKPTTKRTPWRPAAVDHAANPAIGVIWDDGQAVHVGGNPSRRWVRFLDILLAIQRRRSGNHAVNGGYPPNVSEETARSGLTDAEAPFVAFPVVASTQPLRWSRQPLRCRVLTPEGYEKYIRHRLESGQLRTREAVRHFHGWFMGQLHSDTPPAPPAAPGGPEQLTMDLEAPAPLAVAAEPPKADDSNLWDPPEAVALVDSLTSDRTVTVSQEEPVWTMPFMVNPQTGTKIRAVKVNGRPGLVARDVALALGYSDPGDAIRRHSKGAVKHRILTEGGVQEALVIFEPDVLRLTIAAAKFNPKADQFEKFVFEEVLPAIRATGRYVAPGSPESQTPVVAGQQQVTEAMRAITLANQQLVHDLRVIRDQSAEIAEIQIRAGKKIQDAEIDITQIKHSVSGIRTDIDCILAGLSRGGIAVPEAPKAPHLRHPPTAAGEVEFPGEYLSVEAFMLRHYPTDASRALVSRLFQPCELGSGCGGRFHSTHDRTDKFLISWAC